VPEDNQSVLVTGASNQIGFFLLPLFKQKGLTVVPVSRKAHEEKVHWLQLDLSNVNLAKKFLPNVSQLIHLGPLDLLPPLLETLHQKGVRRIIAFSSTSVFVKQGSSDLQEKEVIQRLAQAELDFQKRCESLAIHWTLFRPTMIYGAGMDTNVHFISECMRRWHFFPVMGKAIGLRQPVHAEDLAQACIDALLNTASYGESYSLSGGETLNYRSFLKRIAEAQYNKVFLVPVPRIIFVIGLIVLRMSPSFKFLNLEMIDRTNRDLCFSHDDAKRDFGYNPRRFLP